MPVLNRWIFSCVAFLAATVAAAQPVQDETLLETVVVTAQRRGTELLNLPGNNSG